MSIVASRSLVKVKISSWIKAAQITVFEIHKCYLIRGGWVAEVHAPTLATKE